MHEGLPRGGDVIRLLFEPDAGYNDEYTAEVLGTIEDPTEGDLLIRLQEVGGPSEIWYREGEGTDDSDANVYRVTDRGGETRIGMNAKWVVVEDAATPLSERVESNL